MNITFYTLGCKVNQYETQSLRESFKRKGYSTVSNDGEFDIAIINSCTVTAESDRKTRQILRRFRHKNPNATIVLTGCMVQAFEKEAKTLTDADVIVGNGDINLVVALTEQFLTKKEKIFKVNKHTIEECFNTPNISDFAERTRAYIKIEDGCDRYCSYCIIPFARGFVRSKPLTQLKTEAETLSKKGFIEIVLVGINLSSYGKGENFNLCDAVDVVCGVEGIKRVRLGSLEPDHIDDNMLSRFKKQEKFCPQFHLSLQSGCDETLKRMNRHYDSAFYSDLVNRIRTMFPDASITTDIMVGFSGETLEEFEKSLEFCKMTGFAKSHIFAYSRRKGTVAYSHPDQIEKSEKSRRSKLMIEATNLSERKFLQNQLGKDFPVLFETLENGYNFGYTPNYTRVAVASDTYLGGQIRTVTLTETKDDYCIGLLK